MIKHWFACLLLTLAASTINMFHAAATEAVRRETQLEVFHSAIRRGNLEEAKKYAPKVNINTKTSVHQMSALAWAVEHGHLEIAKWLIAEGADTQSRDLYEQTPLMLAASKCNAPMIRLLWRHTYDLEKEDKTGFTVFRHAARANCETVEDFLLLFEANIGHKDIQERTVLFDLVVQDRVERIKSFRKAGLDLDDFDESNIGLVNYAIQARSIKALDYLLQQNTLMHSPRSICSPLRLALIYRFHEALPLLIEHGFNINGRLYDGYTPINFVAKYREFESFQAVLDAGADPKQVGDFRYDRKAGSLIPSIEVYMNTESTQYLEALFEKGFPLDYRSKLTNNEESFIHIAALAGDIELLKFFLNKGIDPNIRDKDGNTALISLAKYNYGYVIRSKREKLRALHADIALILLKAGADRNLRNNEGKTALDVSTSAQITDILNF